MKVWVAEGALIWRITELEMHLETWFRSYSFGLTARKLMLTFCMPCLVQCCRVVTRNGPGYAKKGSVMGRRVLPGDQGYMVFES